MSVGAGEPAGLKDSNRTCKVERINGSEKKYSIYLNSSIEKKIISKDTKGDPSIIQLNILVMYEVKDKNKILISDQIRNYSNYNNISDKFELKKYEDILVENSAERLSENIIASITTIRWLLNHMI